MQKVYYDLSNEKTREREISAFNEFESSEKYIITMDKNSYSFENIKIINIFDFLMDDIF